LLPRKTTIFKSFLASDFAAFGLSFSFWIQIRICNTDSEHELIERGSSSAPEILFGTIFIYFYNLSALDLIRLCVKVPVTSVNKKISLNAQHFCGTEDGYNSDPHRCIFCTIEEKHPRKEMFCKLTFNKNFFLP
jgi:hypothetical protein